MYSSFVSSKRYTMSRFLLTCTFILLVTCLFGQDGRTLHAGISVEPGMSWLVFDDPDYSPASRSVHASLAGHAILDLGTRFQASLGLGLRYLNVDQIDYTSTWGCDHNGTGSLDPFHSWVEVDYSQVYLSVPLGLKWKLFPGQNSLYVKGGASGEFFFGRSGSVDVYECGLLSTISSWPGYDPEQFLVLGQVGVGYELMVKEKSTFFIEPSISYSFSRLFEPMILINNSRFMAAGLSIGWIFG